MKSAVFSIICVQLSLMIWMNWNNAIGRTESGHLAAAAYWLRTGKFDVFCVNPPLTRIFIAIPLAILKPEIDLSRYSAECIDRCEWDLATDFLAANDEAMIRKCVFWGRCSLLPFLVVGPLAGFRLAQEMSGNLSGVLFLTMFCFSPTLLAWGATLCPDASAASFGIVGLYLLIRWLQRPRASSAFIAGLGLGLLLATKLTWIIALFLWPLLWIIHHCYKNDTSRPTFKQLTGLLFTAIVTVNVVYGFEGTFRPLREFRFYSSLFSGQNALPDDLTQSQLGNRFAANALAMLPVPLPTPVIQGIDTQRFDFEHGMPSFMAGKWADHGWLSFYLYALLVKEPSGFWVLVALLIPVALYGYPKGERFIWLASILVGASLFAFVSIQTGFSANARYSAPALPFFYMAVSPVLDKRLLVSASHLLRRWLRFLQLAAIAAVCWFVISSLSVFPHSLAFFNEFSGGPTRGGYLLLGSNLDVGQDLYRFRDWLAEHPEVRLKGISVTSALPREPDGIPAVPSCPALRFGPHRYEPLKLEVGWYAISINNLHDREGRYRYFLQYFKPAVRIGCTIWIYYIDDLDVHRIEMFH